jgi:ATP-dependent Clp protease adaptor protein ClpS
VSETVTELKEKQQTALTGPWQVVVFDDPVNLMSYVTMVFMRVFGYPRSRAEHHMLEVHRNGRSVVWVGDRERAETYVAELQSYQLLSALERPAE